MSNVYVTFEPATPYLMNLKVALGGIDQDIKALRETQERLGEGLKLLCETRDAIKNSIARMG
jgi:hypothetical protein